MLLEVKKSLPSKDTVALPFSPVSDRPGLRAVLPVWTKLLPWPLLSAQTLSLPLAPNTPVSFKPSAAPSPSRSLASSQVARPAMPASVGSATRPQRLIRSAALGSTSEFRSMARFTPPTVTAVSNLPTLPLLRNTSGAVLMLVMLLYSLAFSTSVSRPAPSSKISSLPAPSLPTKPLVLTSMARTVTVSKLPPLRSSCSMFCTRAVSCCTLLRPRPSSLTLSTPAPPSMAAKLSSPGATVSLPAPPRSVSAPPPPNSTLWPELPVMRLALALPVPLTLPLPVSSRFSKAAPSTQLALARTVSVPAPSCSCRVSPALSTM